LGGGLKLSFCPQQLSHATAVLVLIDPPTIAS
jgi:hypothetical protein